MKTSLLRLFLFASSVGYIVGCSDQNPGPIASFFFGEKNDSSNSLILTKRIVFSRYQIVADNNKDGVINPGETAYLQVYLKNTGSSQVNSVKASISTTNSNVSSLTPTSQVTYGTLTSGSEDYGDYASYYDGNNGNSVYYTVRFTVSNTTPSGTEIPLYLSIKDAEGNSWNDSCNITVQATSAKITYSRYVLVADNNKDGVINPGETAYLQVYLKNTGSSQANTVKATISTTNSYVSGLGPTSLVTYGTLISGGEILGDYNSHYYGNNGLAVEYTVSFTVSSTTPSGTSIPLSLNIIDAEGNTWTDTFTVTVQATSAKITYSRYVLVADNNKDGVINPGETAYLQVYLKNTGSSQANTVKATISTTNSYVSGLGPTSLVTYGTLISGGEILGDYNSHYYGNNGLAVEYTVSFTVSSTTPSGTSIPLSLNIIDAEGNTWTDTFTVTVQATSAKITYSRYVLVADNNKDGVINPGETAYLQVYLKNTGSSQANTVKATISTTNSYVSGLGPTSLVTYGTLISGGEILGDYNSHYYGNNGLAVEYTVSFTVSSTTPSGTSIPLSLNIIDAEGNTWTDTFTVTVH